MSEYNAGTAYLQILPSLSEFREKLKAELDKIDVQYNVAVEPEVSKEFKAKVEAELRDIPPVEITAESSEAETKLAGLRAQLEALRDKKIGVDVKADDAYAQLEAIHAEVDGLKDSNFQLNADTATAETKLAGVAAEIKAIGEEKVTAQVDVELDPTSLVKVREEVENEPPVTIPTRAGTPATFDPRYDETEPFAPPSAPTFAKSPIDQAWTAQIQSQIREISNEALKIPVEPDSQEYRAELAQMLAEVAVEAKQPISIEPDKGDQYRLEVEATVKSVAEQVKAKIGLEVDPASIPTFDAEVKSASDTAKSSSSTNGGGGLGFGGLIAAGVGVASGAVGGVALAAVPAVFGAIGVEAEKSSAAVQQSTAQMTASAKQAIDQGFAPMVPAIQGVEGQISSTLTGLKPIFAEDASAAVPLLTTMSTGLLNATREGVTASVPLLGSLGPVATSVGNGFVTLERGVGGFLSATDPKTAAAGFDALFNAIGQILPAAGSLLNDIAPLGTSLLNVAGPAAHDFGEDMVVLKPLIDAVSVVINALSPEIAAVAPPTLAVLTATKLLTGSWTDFSGAAAKVKSVFTDAEGQFDKGQSTLNSLAKVVGINTQASRDQAAADARTALQKAQLTKAAADEAVAQAVETAQNDETAKSALAVGEAQAVAAAAAKEETAAQKALTAANEASAFSFGPLGIALAAIGAAVALVGLNSSSAQQQVQDVSQQIIQLGQSSATASGQMVAGSPDLQKYQQDLTTIGSSVQAFTKAYSGNYAAGQQYTNGLKNAQAALAAQHETVTQTIQDNADQTTTTVQTTVSVAQLTSMVQNHTIALEDLSAPQQRAVQEYEAYGRVLPQATSALNDLKASQDAETQQLASQGITIDANTKQWNALGTNIGNTVTSFNDATSGVKALTDNMVAAQSAAQQAIQNFQQLDLAARQAQDSADQANQGVTDAQHSQIQAGQAVTDAQHNEAQAAIAVQTAQNGVATAIQGVKNAEQQLTNAQLAETQAQVNLTAARQAAADQLKTLQNQVADQSDTQAQAQLQLLQAQQAVNAAGLQGQTLAGLGAPTAANEQAFQLLLALSQAQHNLNDVTLQGSQLNQQWQTAQAQGVNGNSQVIQAQQQVTQAQQQAIQATQGLQQAQQGVTSASQGLSNAQYAETQAHIATQNAVYSEQQAQIALSNAKEQQSLASQALTLAKDADSTSTDINTAAGTRNFTTIENLFEANFKATGNIQDATIATEQQGQQMGIAKTAVDAIITSISKVPAQTQFAIIGTPSLNLGALLQQASAEGISPYSLGLPSNQVTLALGPRGSSYATGGLITGPGTGTSDSIPAITDTGSLLRVSNKEFIVNAEATARHLPLLETINREGLPGFASGGQVDTNAQDLIGLNLRLAGWDAILEGTSNALHVLGDTAAPNLPTGSGSIDFGALAPAATSNGAIASSAVPAQSGSAAQAQAYALSQLSKFGWGPDQMPDLIRLWNQESGWNAYAVNPSSGAYGIPQALGHGHPYNLGDYANQIQWGLSYIKGRYGSPDAAWAHEVANNWYDGGGWLPPGITVAHNDTGSPEAILTGDQWAAIKASIQSPQGNGGQFTGNLYLSSGEWMGHVVGAIEDAFDVSGQSLRTRTR